MKRLQQVDPYLETKLLGIMLAGVLTQTRAECTSDRPFLTELKPSGVHRIVPHPGGRTFPDPSLDEP